MSFLKLQDAALEILDLEKKRIDAIPREARDWKCPYCSRTFRWPRTHVQKQHLTRIRLQVLEDWKKKGGDKIDKPRLAD